VEKWGQTKNHKNEIIAELKSSHMSRINALQWIGRWLSSFLAGTFRHIKHMKLLWSKIN